MIGIYQDDFKEYLKSSLGHVKETSKNLIIPCPFCEYGKDKDHYHMYISTEAPIFHCFHAGCEKSGVLRNLIKKIEGKDISDQFIDKDKLEEFKSKREVFVNIDDYNKEVILPELKESVFVKKDLYIKKRLKFSVNSTKHIKGLIYDIDSFIELNHIPVNESLFRLREYLQANFVGFLTENKSTVLFRNIDHSHAMKFYKLKVQETNFLDYYKIPGGNPNSNKIVLAEGIFDIFTTSIFDDLKIHNDIRMYASALSSKYLALIQSIIFGEMVFKPEIIILSDNGIDLQYYKNMKKYNRHIIDILKVYYNKSGKDFNDTPIFPVLYNVGNEMKGKYSGRKKVYKQPRSFK